MSNQPNINFIVKGSGPTVVLSHGIAASLHNWDALIPALVKSGYRVIAHDLLGHGDSDKPENIDAYQACTLYSAFEQLLSQVIFDEPVILIGHSMGGFLSLEYSLNHSQRVRGLVLISPYYTPEQLSKTMQILYWWPRAAEKAIQLVPHQVINTLMGWDPSDSKIFSKSTRVQIATDYKRAAPKIVYIPRTLPDLSPELSLIHHPVQVIWGKHDLTLIPHYFPKLVSQLPGASGIAIEHSGHQPHVRHPELVNRLVLDFVKKLS
jgi:pimeloyl-ACP methyl ester carboxylesterase